MFYSVGSVQATAKDRVCGEDVASDLLVFLRYDVKGQRSDVTAIQQYSNTAMVSLSNKIPQRFIRRLLEFLAYRRAVMFLTIYE